MPLFRRNVCNRGSPNTCRLTQLAVFVFALSIAASAHAATYYVATTGSDSNPGTQAAPFKTLAKGSRALAAGDTLFIRGGTYNEPMIDGSGGFVFRNGTPGAMTRYASYPGEQATIIGPPGVFVVYFSKKAQYIELSGLIIDGTNASSYAIRLDGDFNTTHATGIRIMSNEIKNGRMGISGGGDCQIIGNNIHNMINYGMYVYFNNGLIENNLIHDNDGPGINLFKQEYPVNGWVIRNNTLYGNGGGYTREDTGNSYTAPAILIARGSHQIYNNILYGNHGGITVGYGSTDVLVANNTVYGSDD